MLVDEGENIDIGQPMAALDTSILEVSQLSVPYRTNMSCRSLLFFALGLSSIGAVGCRESASDDPRDVRPTILSVATLPTML